LGWLLRVTEPVVLLLVLLLELLVLPLPVVKFCARATGTPSTATPRSNPAAFHCPRLVFMSVLDPRAKAAATP
jgi:hypothetical protein